MPFQTISFNGDELPGHLPADIQFVVQQQQPYPACPLPLLLGGNAPLASRVPFRNRPVKLARFRELHARSGSGPNAYLLEQLTEAETKAEGALSDAAQLRAVLQNKEQALEDAQRKLQLMHRDLQVMLEQRNVLDSLKAGLSTVMTLHGQAPPLQPSQAQNVQWGNSSSKR